MLPPDLEPWGAQRVRLTDRGALALAGGDEGRVLAALREGGRLRVAELQERSGVVALAPLLERLREQGKVVVEGGERHAGSRYRPAVELASGHTEDLAGRVGRSPQGRTVVAFLAALGRPATVEEVTQAVSCTPAVVRRLVKLGVLRSFLEIHRLSLEGHLLGRGAAPPVRLRPDQEAALSRLRQALATPGYQGFLLQGMTGSGKTEVYLRAARTALDDGRGALLLLPEIALVPALARSGARALRRTGGGAALGALGAGAAAGVGARARRARPRRAGSAFGPLRADRRARAGGGRRGAGPLVQTGLRAALPWPRPGAGARSPGRGGGRAGFGDAVAREPPQRRGGQARAAGPHPSRRPGGAAAWHSRRPSRRSRGRSGPAKCCFRCGCARRSPPRSPPASRWSCCATVAATRRCCSAAPVARTSAATTAACRVPTIGAPTVSSATTAASRARCPRRAPLAAPTRSRRSAPAPSGWRSASPSSSPRPRWRCSTATARGGRGERRPSSSAWHAARRRCSSAPRWSPRGTTFRASPSPPSSPPTATSASPTSAPWSAPTRCSPSSPGAPVVASAPGGW